MPRLIADFVELGEIYNLPPEKAASAGPIENVPDEADEIHAEVAEKVVDEFEV
jgi:hypothetical protein